MVRINLGCGTKYLEDYLNIDKSNIVRLDLLFNLDDPKIKLPIENEDCEEILAEHILEHITNIISLMNECYRILKKGSRMIIKVPQGEGMWADPTHVRFFSPLSWRYYCDYPTSEVYGIECHFRLVSCEYEPNQDGGQLIVVLEK